jgi:hypothetical protein
MALTTTISVQDGASAAVNLAANVSANVTPGNTLVIAPQVSTGFIQWTVTLQSDYGPLNGFTQTFPGPLFSLSLPLPQQPCRLIVTSEATDGNNIWQTTNILYNYARTGVTSHSARLVGTLAVTIANANVVFDGVAAAQGDEVLLVNQANGVQNGLYVVGVPTSNVAALTRPADYGSGQVLKAPVVFEISEGSSFSNSTWKITSANAVTVDTSNVQIYPRMLKGAIANVASANAAANVTGLWILSNTSVVLVQSNTAANAATYVSANVGNAANAGYFTVLSTANAAGTWLLMNW